MYEMVLKYLDAPRAEHCTRSKITHIGLRRWPSTPILYFGRDPSITQERSRPPTKKVLLHPVCVPCLTNHNDSPAQQLAKKRYDDLIQTTSELLISGSDDHTLFLWSPLSSKKPLSRLTGHQRQVSHVAFSPDGRWAASASWDSSVRVWEGRTGKFVATLRGHVGAVYRLAWSADSRLLISASKDSTLKVCVSLSFYSIPFSSMAQP
jgi:WD40 repeat protein